MNVEELMASVPKRAEERPALASFGAIALVVEGRGAWTVDARRTGARPLEVRRGAELDADAVLALGAEDFERLTRGEAPVNPVAQGDLRLITSLGRLLEAPARGALGIRLAHEGTSSSAQRKTRRRTKHV